jgi:hypothetical protein
MGCLRVVDLSQGMKTEQETSQNHCGFKGVEIEHNLRFGVLIGSNFKKQSDVRL